MADFKKAWAKTSTNEGGYINNSKDSGKETYRGITIVSNPKWSGWDVVHKAILDLGIHDTLDCPKDVRSKIDAKLAEIPELDELVQSIYKKNYWDPLNLDNEPDQLIAEQVFDSAVNLGVATAKRFIDNAKGKYNA